jgi:hypothetical protein
MSAQELPAFALDFVRHEFVPTMLALADAALREPLTWAVLAAFAVPAWWRRRRASTPARRP